MDAQASLHSRPAEHLIPHPGAGLGSTLLPLRAYPETTQAGVPVRCQNITEQPDHRAPVACRACRCKVSPVRQARPPPGRTR
jgi:hypothetical protein